MLIGEGGRGMTRLSSSSDKGIAVVSSVEGEIGRGIVRLSSNSDMAVWVVPLMAIFFDERDGIDMVRGLLILAGVTVVALLLEEGDEKSATKLLSASEEVMVVTSHGDGGSGVRIARCSSASKEAMAVVSLLVIGGS